MARSKDVYAVLGLMCVDREFRNDFFKDPHRAANRLVGSLTVDELEQIKRVAGEVGIDSAAQAVYVRQLKDRFDGVYMTMNCPNFPCPDPDPFSA